MPTSVFLAKLLGPFFAVVGISVLINAAAFRGIVKEFLNSPALIFLSGLLTLPVGLALYSRAAPKGLGGMMIAVYYMHLFLGNTLTGYLGGLLDKMSAVSFWLLHAGLMGVAAAVLLGARIAFGRFLAPESRA